MAAVKALSTSGVVYLRDVIPTHQASVTLTNAQIKALPTTGIQIVAAAGSGIVLIPIYAFGRITGSVAYTNINASSIVQFVNTSTGSQTFLDGRNTTFAVLTELFGVLGVAGIAETYAFFSSYLENGTANATKSNLSNLSDIGNKGIFVKINNQGSGDLTGGDDANTGLFTVIYRALDITTGEFV